mmetsp:Transcript_26220/g.80722  ORF Transcript_26220/g.80722 Transcript_26220/m.80722 type:complete len:222 (-) Transcript_26220:660-1325(-)
MAANGQHGGQGLHGRVRQLPPGAGLQNAPSALLQGKGHRRDRHALRARAPRDPARAATTRTLRDEALVLRALHLRVARSPFLRRAHLCAGGRNASGSCRWRRRVARGDVAAARVHRARRRTQLAVARTETGHVVGRRARKPGGRHIARLVEAFAQHAPHRLQLDRARPRHPAHAALRGRRQDFRPLLVILPREVGQHGRARARARFGAALALLPRHGGRAF